MEEETVMAEEQGQLPADPGSPRVQIADPITDSDRMRMLAIESLIKNHLIEVEAGLQGAARVTQGIASPYPEVVESLGTSITRVKEVLQIIDEYSAKVKSGLFALHESVQSGFASLEEKFLTKLAQLSISAGSSDPLATLGSAGKRKRTSLAGSIGTIEPEPEGLVPEYSALERIEFLSQQFASCVTWLTTGHRTPNHKGDAAFYGLLLCGEVLANLKATTDITSPEVEDPVSAFASELLHYIPETLHVDFLNRVGSRRKILKVHAEPNDEYALVMQVLFVRLNLDFKSIKQAVESKLRNTQVNLTKNVERNVDDLRSYISLFRSVEILFHEESPLPSNLVSEGQLVEFFLGSILPKNCALGKALHERVASLATSTLGEAISALHDILQEYPQYVVHYPDVSVPHALLPKCEEVSFAVSRLWTQRPYQGDIKGEGKDNPHCRVCYAHWYQGGEDTVPYSSHPTAWCPRILGIWKPSNPLCNPGPSLTTAEHYRRIADPHRKTGSSHQQHRGVATQLPPPPPLPEEYVPGMYIPGTEWPAESSPFLATPGPRPARGRGYYVGRAYYPGPSSSRGRGQH